MRLSSMINFNVGFYWVTSNGKISKIKMSKTQMAHTSKGRDVENSIVWQ